MTYKAKTKRHLSRSLLLLFGFYLASGWFVMAHQAQHHQLEVSSNNEHHACQHAYVSAEQSEGIALTESPNHEHCYFCALTLLVPAPMDIGSNDSAFDPSLAVVDCELSELFASSREYTHSGRAPPVKI